MAQFAGAGVLLAAAVLGIVGLYLVHRLTAVHPDPVTVLPFLSGAEPEQHGCKRCESRPGDQLHADPGDRQQPRAEAVPALVGHAVGHRRRDQHPDESRDVED